MIQCSGCSNERVVVSVSGKEWKSAGEAFITQSGWSGASPLLTYSANSSLAKAAVSWEALVGDRNLPKWTPKVMQP